MKTKRQIVEELKRLIKENEESRKRFYEKYREAKSFEEKQSLLATMRIIENRNEGIEDAIRIIDFNTAPWED